MDAFSQYVLAPTKSSLGSEVRTEVAFNSLKQSLKFIPGAGSEVRAFGVLENALFSGVPCELSIKRQKGARRTIEEALSQRMLTKVEPSDAYFLSSGLSQANDLAERL